MNAERQTVIGHSTLDKLVLYGGFPVVGVLKARAKAMKAGDKGKSDVREFRLEINKLGYAVRDEEGKQFVRAAGKP